MKDTREDLDSWREEILACWKDARVIKREELDALIWFFWHSYADFAQLEMTLDGISLREKGGDWLMVVKVTQAGIPYVVFVGSATPTRCMLKLRSRLRSGDCRLVEDKFR